MELQSMEENLLKVRKRTVSYLLMMMYCKKTAEHLSFSPVLYRKRFGLYASTTRIGYSLRTKSLAYTEHRFFEIRQIRGILRQAG